MLEDKVKIHFSFLYLDSNLPLEAKEKLFTSLSLDAHGQRIKVWGTTWLEDARVLLNFKQIFSNATCLPCRVRAKKIANIEA